MENLAFTHIEPVFRKLYLFFYVFTVSPRTMTPERCFADRNFGMIM